MTPEIPNINGTNLIFKHLQFTFDYFTFYYGNYLLHAMLKFKISHIELPKFDFLCIIIPFFATLRIYLNFAFCILNDILRYPTFAIYIFIILTLSVSSVPSKFLLF